MMKKPAISVVIPTYNRADWLRECLESVRNQTLQPLELIVVDDGSTDQTAALCREFPMELEYIYQDQRGVSAARNRGIAAARYDWIALLDSDDLWVPDKLRRQWDAIQADSSLRVLQTEEIWIRNGRRVNPREIHRKPSGWVFEEMIPLCLVSPSAVMIHREVFDRCGHFDEELPACEDYDLWLRIALHFKVETLRDALTIKRGGHEDQLSRQWGLDRYRIQALLKILDDAAINEEQKKIVKSDIRRRCDILIKGFAKRDNASATEYYAGVLDRMKSS